MTRGKALRTAALLLLLLAAAVVLSRKPSGKRQRPGSSAGPATGAMTEEADPSMAVLVGSYSSHGYGATARLRFPRAGGRVTGSIQGDCSGTIAGTYEPGGTLLADASGTCRIAFLPISAKAAVRGTVARSFDAASLRFTARAVGKTFTGELPLAAPRP